MSHHDEEDWFVLFKNSVQIVLIVCMPHPCNQCFPGLSESDSKQILMWKAYQLPYMQTQVSTRMLSKSYLAKRNQNASAKSNIMSKSSLLCWGGFDPRPDSPLSNPLHLNPSHRQNSHHSIRVFAKTLRQLVSPPRLFQQRHVPHDRYVFQIHLIETFFNCLLNASISAKLGPSFTLLLKFWAQECRSSKEAQHILARTWRWDLRERIV